MKTATKSILIAAILTVNVLNANANRYFRIVTDSVCTYSFDYNANNYKLASVSYYYYNNYYYYYSYSGSGEKGKGRKKVGK